MTTPRQLPSGMRKPPKQLLLATSSGQDGEGKWESPDSEKVVSTPSHPTTCYSAKERERWPSHFLAILPTTRHPCHFSSLSRWALRCQHCLMPFFLLPFIHSVIHNPFNYLSTTVLCWTQWSKAVNQVLLVWEILRGWERQGSLLDSVSTPSVKSKVLDLMATPTLFSQSLQTPSCPARRVLRHSAEYSTSESPTGSAV